MTAVASGAGWQPDPSGLRQVVGMLRESTQGSNAAQESVYRKLEAYATHADFNNYLAYILAHGADDAAAAAAVAAAAAAATAAAAAAAGGTGTGVHEDGYQQQEQQQARASEAQADAGTAAAAATAATTAAASEGVRQAAGMLLKNNLRALYKNLSPDIRSYINNELLSAIGDHSRLVRSAVAVCITAIVSKAGLHVWPDLFPTLIRCLDSNEDASLDGALNALCRICEDAPDLLDEDPSQPLDVIIPKLFAFFQHPNDAVRIKVVHILNQFLLVMPPALNDNIDSYLAALFRVAEDASFEVRKRVCSAICMLLETKPEALAPHMPNIIRYMLHASKDSSEVVVLEACEFWSAFAEMPNASAALRDYLPQLIPILLENMVYSEQDQAIFASEAEDDEMTPDKPEDAAPRFHQARQFDPSAAESSAPDTVSGAGTPIKTSFSSSVPAPIHTGSHVASNISGFNGSYIDQDTRSGNENPQGGSPGSSTPPYGDFTASRMTGSNVVSGFLRPAGPGASVKVVDSVFAIGTTHGEDFDRMKSRYAEMQYAREEDRVDEDDEDDEDVGGEWNVRKCSSSALDALSMVFGEELLVVLLPLLQEKLLDTGCWEQRESGVLALGAVAEGCYTGIVPHMPRLFPYLLSSLDDQHHCVRIISCWTLSRYSRWVTEQKDENKLQQILKALLDRMIDRNKAVQRSACSAFASFEEQVGPALTPYISHILQTMTYAFEKYQQNNMVMLLDTVCTLADAVGGELASQEHINTLMPCLMKRWNTITDNDRGLIPLFECLTYVFRALGRASQSFALPVFTRCINVVDMAKGGVAGDNYDPELSDFITCSLDLMCSLTEALGAGLDPLVVSRSNSGSTLLQLLFACMRDKRQEVRQSAFALVGEFARAGLPSLIPVMKDYVEAVIEALSPDYMLVANNATWALGELVMMAGFLPSGIPIDRQAIQKPLLERALPTLVRIVNIRQLSKSLLENAAITLGRMGLVMPDAVAPKLELFAEAALAALRNVPDHADKEQAFFGVNAMIKLNPTAILKCFAYYVDAVASWLHVNPKLEAEFGTILVGYKNSLGEQWQTLHATFPPPLQICLRGRFNL